MKLEDRIIAMSAEIETAIIIIEQFPSRNIGNVWQASMDHLKVTASSVRKLLNMKKHDQLPDWEMALAQTKRCLDAQMPEEADRIFARLSLGPPPIPVR